MEEEEEKCNFDPIGSRYDDLIQIFGQNFVTKLGALKMFMVGCGALGCELMKNCAINGVATTKCGGLLTVTDNDHVEVSNLSRQFLFREHNVKQPKSKAAAAAVIAMNPGMCIDAKELLVAPATESTFNNEFWQGLDVVLNALDNVKARNYVDSKCVFYERPLLESGTLGTKCNTQCVIPT